MKFTTKFLSFFMLLFALSVTFVSGKASAGSYDSDSSIKTVDLPYDGEEYAGITPRSIEYTFNEKNATVYIDSKTFSFELPEPIRAAGGDVHGSLWFSTLTEDYTKKIYWLNYELEGDKMTPHFFCNGGLWYTNSNFTYYGGFQPEGSKEIQNIPTPTELKESISSTPFPTQTPAAPVPTQAATPVPTQTPGNVVPTQVPSTQASTQNIQKVTNKISKTNKTKVTLLSTTGKVLKTVKFNKKTGIMVYNNKKVKNVKAVFFTKKGTVVYFTKSKKAYYFIGKKRILIKSKVSSIKTYKGFATQLVIKKGKKTKSIKLKK